MIVSVTGDGAALSCCVTRLSLRGGGPVRAGAAFATGRGPPGIQKKENCRSVP